MEQDLGYVCTGQGSLAENWKPSILITTRDLKRELGAYKIFPGTQGASSGLSFLEWLQTLWNHASPTVPGNRKSRNMACASFPPSKHVGVPPWLGLRSWSLWECGNLCSDPGALLWSRSTCSTGWGRSWVSQCLPDSESVSPALRKIRKHLKPPRKKAVTFRFVT